jgi:ATP synthase F1 delta subunit
MLTPISSTIYYPLQVESTLEDGKVSHITKNFLSTLAGNGRISECSEVVSNYEELLRTARGSISITVTSADSLSKAQVDSVSSAVKAMVGKKFTCDINYAVDAKIMGGLQVMVGEKFLDLSISQRMSELSKELEGL